MANKELLVRIAADSREAVAALKKIDQSAQQTSGVMAKLDGAMKGALAAFSAGAVLDFAKDTVQAAAALEDSVGAVESIFGDASDQIFEFGETAAESAGLAKSEFNQAAAELGNSLQNAGLSADGAADATLRLTERAADVAALMGTDVSEALDAVQASLRGEFDPIEKFTGGMSAAAVEAKALEMGLIDTGGEMDNTAKVAATLELFFERTTKAAGQFAREADGVGGSMKTAQAQAEDLKAEIGQSLQPATLALLDAFKELAPTVAQAGTDVGNLVSDLTPLIEALSETKTAADDLGSALIEQEGFWARAFSSTQLGALTRLKALYSEYNEQVGDAVERHEELANSSKNLGDKQVYLKTVGKNLEDQVREEAEAMQAASLRTGEFKRAIEDLSRTQAEAADPALALINANIRLQDAQEKVNDAIKEHGRNSDEARDASLELVSAQGDLEAASARFGREGGAESIEALRQMAGRAGDADGIIADVIASIERLNSTPIKLPGLRDDGTFNPGGGGSSAQFVPVASKTLSAPAPAPAVAPPMAPIVVQLVVDGRKFFEDVIVPQAERYAQRTGRSVFP